MTVMLTCSTSRSALPVLLTPNEEEQGLLIRKDPKTGETVGVTILDYKEHFRQLPDLFWLATKPLPEELIAYLGERPALHS